MDHELEGFRIEGQPRSRYVAATLEREAAEGERVLISIQEAARRFGVSTFTIRVWIERGRLESFRVEGSRRVYVDAGESNSA